MYHYKRKLFSGKPSSDPDSPDYAPSINMSNKKRTRSPSKSKERYERQAKRRKQAEDKEELQRKVLHEKASTEEAAEALLSMANQPTYSTDTGKN